MASADKQPRWPDLIRRHPELHAMPPALRAAATVANAGAGEVLGRLGDRPRQVFYVVAGELQLVRHSRGGSPVVLQRASAGFVAEASLESPRYHCDVVAVCPSAVLCLPLRRFRECLREDEAFRTFWMRRLARTVRALRAHCERLSLRGAAERIEHYVECEGRDGRLELRRTRKAWAAELGLTHEALYRALARLTREGRIFVQERDGALLLTMASRLAPAGRA